MTISRPATAADIPTAADTPAGRAVDRRSPRWAARLAIGVVAVAAVLGMTSLNAALAAAGTDGTAPRPVGAAERAIATLVGDRPADAVLPGDFADRLGYRPTVIDGRPLNPGGDCSSPVPLPDAFFDACRAHDLGYDLLRYADATGRPAAPWARGALDRRLIDDMHAVCTDPGCAAAAEAARLGLALNTWRQRSGPPVPESDGEIAIGYIARTLESAGLR